jgi:hypothetical protein
LVAGTGEGLPLWFNGDNEFEMKISGASRTAILVAVLTVLALAYLTFGDGKDKQRPQADQGAGKTESVAARAGARVMPTDPNLKVEPK